MALAIAGTPVGTFGAAGSTVSTTYSVPANSLVIAVVSTYGFTGLGFCPLTGVSDSGGLTWHRRRQTQFQSAYAGAGTNAGAVFITQEIWWAFATAAQTAQSVTAAVGSSSNESLGADMIVFGVSGVQNTSAPWDDNPSLSGSQTFGSASATQAINPTATTSQANSMVFGFLQAFTSSLDTNVPTVGTGFTSVINNSRGASPNNIFVGVEQKVQATAGATAAPWVNAEQEYVSVVDALSGTATGSSADTSVGLHIHGTPVETFNGAPSTNTIAGTISTTAPTVLFAVVNTYNFTGSGAIVTVTGVSGGGLTWNKRSSTAGQNGTSFSLNQEVWWANATGALTAQTITATLSATPSQSVDLMLFAVSGSPTPSAPFDTHAGLPATVSKMNAGQLSSMTASNTTSSTTGMLLAFAGYAWNAHTDSTLPPGYSDISTPQINHTLNAFWDQKATVAAGANSVTWGNTQEFFQITFDALNGNAAAGPTGTISTALSKPSLSVAASEKFTGSIATNLTKVSQQLRQSQPVSGTVTTSLRKFNLAATDVEVFIGTITTNLSRINSAGAGLQAREIFVGQITTRLSPAHMAAIGEEDFIGRVVTRLGNADGHIAATVVQAEVIVLGPIQMTLPPFRPLILGAKLGTPGAGKWYSWRFTDS